MLVFLFTAILFSATIYSFIKKKYIYLFFPCLLFLPKYYGIEFSESLPIITTARVLIVIFFIYAYKYRKKDLSPKSIINKISTFSFPKEMWFLFGYFLFRIITNMFYFTTNVLSAKNLFGIIFEHLFILIGIYLLSPTEEERNTIVKSVVYAATIIFTLGIFESFTFIRLFNVLYTISRPMLNVYYVRLGLLRSTASLGLPNFFGNACILVLPLILYLYNLTHQKRYLLSLTITLFATIHSGCRSDILFFALIILTYAIFIVSRLHKEKEFFKNTLLLSTVCAMSIALLSIANPHWAYYYSGTAKSLLNVIGFDYDLDSGAPDDTNGYGDNIDGTESRTRQFTGIYYVLKIKPLVGLGTGAHTRGKVKYYWDNTWYPAKSYDVGVVEIFCDEGILGLIGTTLLIIYSVLESYKNKNRFYMLSIFCYILSTLSSSNMFMFLILYIIVYSKTKKI